MRTQLFVTVLACSLWLESLKNALVFVSRMIAGLLLFPCYIFLVMTLFVVSRTKPENNGESFLYKQILRCYRVGKKIHEKVMARPLHWEPPVDLRVEPED